MDGMQSLSLEAFADHVIQVSRHRNGFFHTPKMKSIPLCIAAYFFYPVKIDQISPVTPEKLRPACQGVLFFPQGGTKHSAFQHLVFKEKYLHIIVLCRNIGNLRSIYRKGFILIFSCKSNGSGKRRVVFRQSKNGHSRPG